MINSKDCTVPEATGHVADHVLIVQLVILLEVLPERLAFLLGVLDDQDLASISKYSVLKLPNVSMGAA